MIIYLSQVIDLNLLFWQIYHLDSIVNDRTCFKNPKKPSYIDHVLTNKQEAKTVETELSELE